MTHVDASAAHDDLQLETSEKVRVLTLNRPERRNALSETLIAQLGEALLAANTDADVRAIVITGATGGGFCAGLDLKEAREGDSSGRGYRPPMQRRERSVLELLLDLDTPTVAAVNGHAVGGGFELALACDLRVVADDALLMLPEARRGMGANFASVLLPKLIPQAIALEILLTAEPISPHRALELGLVNRVVPGADVVEVARRLAESIASNAPVSVRRMKNVATKGRDLPVPFALRMDVGPNPYESEDRKEGITAFLEKREPRWKGR